MTAASNASWPVSTQVINQPRSRTASASLCSTPNAPGSSRARLPTLATAGSAGVLDQLELGVLAFGDDVLAVHLAVGDHRRDRLHDRVIRPDRIGSDDVHVGQPQRVGDSLGAREQQLLFARDLLRLPSRRRGLWSDSDDHGYSSPPATTGTCLSGTSSGC